MASRGPLPEGVRFERRQDLWWLQPLIVVVVLGAFVIYTTFRVFENNYFLVEPYLSPFYSPKAGWWPLSPALLVLWAPLGFRLTCYYYRKAYYRVFFWDPPACAIGEPRKGYEGERGFPFVLQNLHRFFVYFAALILGFLWYDAVKAFMFPDGFGVGIGTLILLGNVIFLSLYTFSCHYVRHISGGCLDCLATRPTRYRVWRWISVLNTRHALWAWVSLLSVAGADLYVRLVASGVMQDLRLV